MSRHQDGHCRFLGEDEPEVTQGYTRHPDPTGWQLLVAGLVIAVVSIGLALLREHHQTLWLWLMRHPWALFWASAVGLLAIVAVMFWAGTRPPRWEDR